MKYVYILESLDSEHFYVGVTDTCVPAWRSIMPARCRTRRNLGLGESGPISRSTTPHALSRSSDTWNRVRDALSRRSTSDRL